MIFRERYKKQLTFVVLPAMGFLMLIIVSVSHGTDRTAPASEYIKFPGPDDFAGEKLSYNMSFWILSGAARGYLQFTGNSNNTYTAVLKAETCGITRFIAGHKEETMKSIMKYDPEKHRMIPLMFREIFSQGDTRREKTIFYDYEKGVYTVSWHRTGRKKITRKRKLPGKEFDDLLSFFYNLRMGHYGTVAAGRHFSVCVLVTTKPSWLRISIDRTLPKATDLKKHHATVSMERSISETGSKMISGWFSSELIPVYCVIEDAYFFGDISVKLKGKEKLRY